MKALVCHGPGKKSWEEKPKPVITAPTDAIVQILHTTICGTDLHIMKGDVPTVTDGRIIGQLAQILDAYETFEHADKEKALKVILSS